MRVTSTSPGAKPEGVTAGPLGAAPAGGGYIDLHRAPKEAVEPPSETEATIIPAAVADWMKRMGQSP